MNSLPFQPLILTRNFLYEQLWNIRPIKKQSGKVLPILVALFLYLTASLVINKKCWHELTKVSIDLFIT